MNVIRALAHTAAGIWLGGIIVIAIVAQTTFSEMRNSGVERPNAVAGQVMARNFGRFNVVQISCAAALLLWQGAALAHRRQGPRDWFRISLIVLATGLLAYHVALLTPKIVDFQPLLARPDAEEAIRAAFQEFHRTAVRVSQALLVVVAAITIEMALPLARRA
ncbi:MAG TPA: DUF4149 domain-containing protein [Phycisphaerae bacterium]|nr:DUF4149 domain-containing protein [Phycisphaerae bacterium]